MTKTETIESPEQIVKNVGEFKLSFKIDWGDEQAQLSILANEALRELLKNVIVPQLEARAGIIEYNSSYTFQRFRGKKLVYNCLDSSTRDVLFSKDLNETGVIVIPIVSRASDIENILTSLRRNVRDIIQLLAKYKDYKCTITFKLEEGTE